MASTVIPAATTSTGAIDSNMDVLEQYDKINEDNKPSNPKPSFVPCKASRGVKKAEVSSKNSNAKVTKQRKVAVMNWSNELLSHPNITK